MLGSQLNKQKGKNKTTQDYSYMEILYIMYIIKLSVDNCISRRFMFLFYSL